MASGVSLSAASWRLRADGLPRGSQTRMAARSRTPEPLHLVGKTLTDVRVSGGVGGGSNHTVNTGIECWSRLNPRFGRRPPVLRAGGHSLGLSYFLWITMFPPPILVEVLSTTFLPSPLQSKNYFANLPNNDAALGISHALIA